MPASQDTVTAIRSSGLELLQQRGLNGFSFRDIADTVGIKTASIHYHFPTKFDLALAILEAVNAAFEEALAALDAENGSAAAKLDGFCAIFLDTYGERGGICPVCMVAIAQESVPERVLEEVRAFWKRGERWLAEVLEAGQRTGELAFTSDPHEIARSYIAALEGALITARAFSERSRIEEAARFLNSGLAARRGAAA